MTAEQRATVLWLIAEDMYRDAQTLDGQPFTGRAVATSFGYLMAATMHLAVVVANLNAKIATGA